VTVRLLAIVFLLLLNGFFAAAEYALVRARRTRLEALVRAREPGARLALRAYAALPRMISASQLGITLASLGLGWVAARLISQLLAGQAVLLPIPVDASIQIAVAGAVALLVLGLLHVVFGELVPRASALNHPEKLARWLSPPLLAFAWLATPLLELVQAASRLVLRLMGESTDPLRAQVHSPAEIRLLVEQSEEEGALLPQDADLIEGVFEFSEKNAGEVMTPRTAIVALPLEATLDETLDIVQEGGFSRYPVYSETIDHIVGVLLAKDLLPMVRARSAGSSPAFSVGQVMREVHVVPAAREVEEVLADFKHRKEHLAVVLDEYGGTAGLVTMEDLLEEIVGEILDEYDESLPPEAVAGAEVLVDGATNIGELNTRFGLSIPDGDYNTIGGFVFGTLGRLPVPGDRLTAGGVVMTVRRVHARRVETLALDLHAAGDRRADERDDDEEKAG
jgi:CBS domain containing-hemolysin-like protein